MLRGVSVVALQVSIGYIKCLRILYFLLLADMKTLTERGFLTKTGR